MAKYNIAKWKRNRGVWSWSKNNRKSVTGEKRYPSSSPDGHPHWDDVGNVSLKNPVVHTPQNLSSPKPCSEAFHSAGNAPYPRLSGSIHALTGKIDHRSQSQRTQHDRSNKLVHDGGILAATETEVSTLQSSYTVQITKGRRDLTFILRHTPSLVRFLLFSWARSLQYR